MSRPYRGQRLALLRPPPGDARPSKTPAHRFGSAAIPRSVAAHIYTEKSMFVHARATAEISEHVHMYGVRIRAAWWMDGRMDRQTTDKGKVRWFSDTACRADSHDRMHDHPHMLSISCANTALRIYRHRNKLYSCLPEGCTCTQQGDMDTQGRRGTGIEATTKCKTQICQLRRP